MDSEIKDSIAISYNLNSKYRESKEIVDWKVVELEKFIKGFDDIKDIYVLDLGAGSGIYAQYLSDKGAKLKCIDISSSMIDMCSEKMLDAEVMDFYNLNFKDNSFNAIWSMNSLLHVPKASIGYVLKGIKRVLETDGIFYLGIYGGKSSEGIYEEDFYQPKRYFSRYEDDELKNILSEYFHILEFKHIDLGLDVYWFQSIIMKNSI